MSLFYRDWMVKFMLFSSMKFVFVFLPIFFIVYYLVGNKYRNYIAFAGSMFFYSFGELRYLPLLLASVGIHYLLSRLIHYSNNNKQKKIYLLLGLCYSFGMLFVFKYAAFVFGLKQLALPLGISFYTFQIVSYLIDVYRGKIVPEKNIIFLGMYLCLFPQLIAGPIVLYTDVEKQIRLRTHSLANIEMGLKYFVLGLASKMLIANVLGSLWNELKMIGFSSISTPMAWLGMFAFSFQIYFDFNGYSLMAIGLGQMMGFTIPKNFDHPYTARSVTEFWRRWHITLGRWFREYVYIPLGGSKVPKYRMIFNLFIVWTLTGIWHGAGWNFVLWGITLFVLIAVEKLWLYKILDKYKFGSHLYLLLVIPMSWMLFAIDSIKNIAIYFQRLLPFLGKTSSVFVKNTDFLQALNKYGIFFVAAIVCSTSIPEKMMKNYGKKQIVVLFLLLLFWISVWQMMTTLNNPFLYFRF